MVERCVENTINVLIIACLALQPSMAANTADPEASTKAHAVLDYLLGLPNRTDNKVVSGQYSDYANSISTLFQQTGKYPGVVGGDYKWDVISTENSFLIGHAGNGGIVTISDHMDNPATGGDAWDVSNVDIVQMITPGTQLNNVFKAELDRIAVGLNQLQQNNVVVLFRPFHEMNGGWFWWGAKDTQQFKNLWIYTFNYLTTTKDLHNLLWVYGPNYGSNVVGWYPGPQYVDIVGVDFYNSQTSFDLSPIVSNYNSLIALGKPFALTEFGPCNPSADPYCPAMDYTQLIANIKQKIPKTVYWMSWNREYAMDKHLNVKSLLDDPWVVTREEISITPGYCGDSICNSAESCSSCAKDCLHAGEVCCLNQTYTGNCCANSDCISPNACVNHACGSGLVAHWRFDEASGSTASDSSGNGNTATVNGPVWRQTGGKINGALEFDGLNDAVSVGDKSSLSFAKQFTFSAWVKAGVAGRSQFIVSKGTCNVHWIEYALQVGYDNKPKVFFSPNSADDQIASASVTLQPNTWYLITGTYDGAAEKIYVNGALSGSLTTAQPMFDSSGTLTIGARATDGSAICGTDGTIDEFNGLIDDVRIYSRALQAQEIQALYMEAPSCHESDNAPCDGCVSILELNSHISKWLDGLATISSLMDAIRLWENTC